MAHANAGRTERPPHDPDELEATSPKAGDTSSIPDSYNAY